MRDPAVISPSENKLQALDNANAEQWKFYDHITNRIILRSKAQWYEEGRKRPYTSFRYRYMYLKTYTKFTFCIKSQGHLSDK